MKYTFENAKLSLRGIVKKLACWPMFPNGSPVDEEMAVTLRPPQPVVLDYWGKKLTVLCSAAAINLALLSPQINYKQLPPIFSFLGLTIILTFTFFFVGKCIRSNFDQAAQVLERIGIFFGVTAIFTAICIPFPLWFKCVCCFIYVLSWFTILVCNYFHSFLLDLFPNKNLPKQNLLPITN